MTVDSRHLQRSLAPERATERLAELVRVPSENPPGDEARAAEVVAAWCTDGGFDVEAHEAEPGRPSVVARWGSGSPTLTFCSHIDVVPAGDHTLWAGDPYSADIAEGRLHGRGSSDAKGPCVAALEAALALKDAGASFDGTLELAFVADEEAMGFKGAGHLVESGVMRPDIGIVGEPTSLRVVRAQRGAAWFRLVTRGVAGHGSAPERGVNAVAHMAEVVRHLKDHVPDLEHPLLGAPTISVGTIRGGEKVNIIPASCVLEVDRRSVPPETRDSVIASVEAAIEAARERYPEIDASVELPFYGKPFEIPASAPVVTAAVDAVASVTGAPAEVIGFRGASDARFIADTGADVIVLGPGDIKLAHTAREFIELDEFHRGIEVYALTFAMLLEMKLP
ncbi:MAG: M20 family metallopeptidase [Actinomycetota bacterium]